MFKKWDNRMKTEEIYEVLQRGKTSEIKEKSALRIWFENMEPEERRKLNEQRIRQEKKKKIMLFILLIVLFVIIFIISDQIIQ